MDFRGQKGAQVGAVAAMDPQNIATQVAPVAAMDPQNIATQVAPVATLTSHRIATRVATRMGAAVAAMDPQSQGAEVVLREGSLAVVYTHHRVATVVTRSHRVANPSLKHPFRKFLPKGM